MPNLENINSSSPFPHPAQRSSIVVGFAVLKASMPERESPLSLNSVSVDRWLTSIFQKEHTRLISLAFSAHQRFDSLAPPSSKPAIRPWQPHLVHLRSEWALQRQFEGQ